MAEADDFEFECPLVLPIPGSSCESIEYEDDGEEYEDDEDEDVCYFNFVKTPGPSPEENDFVPSIACSCNDDRWKCGIAPEYLRALAAATSG